MASGPPLVVTMGEPAGVGPELTAIAWLRRREEKLPAFIYVGDMGDLARRISQCGLVVPLRETALSEAASVFPDALPVINVTLKKPGRAGVPTPANAPAVIEAISTAVSFCLNGQASGVITNPIQKSTLTAAGFTYSGHTDFLGALARDAGHDSEPVMLLACDELRVVPVTVHCPLREVMQQLSSDLIVKTARVVAADMRRLFGFHSPRIAISGLNPHAGEDGTLGREEIVVIQPAIDLLRREGMKVQGPLPADTMFHAAAREKYDVALCMYHDQALIPIKALAFERAVNVTLGLPFLRTSPDHGTALSLAGSGTADPSSLLHAIALAGQLAGAGMRR